MSKGRRGDLKGDSDTLTRAIIPLRYDDHGFDVNAAVSVKIPPGAGAADDVRIGDPQLSMTSDQKTVGKEKQGDALIPSDICRSYPVRVVNSGSPQTEISKL